MQDFILFLMSFLLIFIIYQVFIVKKYKNIYSGKKKYKNLSKVHPVEIMYLCNKYNLDLEKIKYNQLLQIVAIVSSFDIALSVSVILLFNNFILEIISGFLSVIVFILISYHLVYLFYKRKGMIKNEKL